MYRSGKLRVAVVGAGAAGLCAARHILSRAPSFESPVVFEQSARVGGTWYYEERVGISDNDLPIHGSMYRDLRTNLPKEIMMFPDFPFDSHLPSFLTHWDVQQYLEAYCKRHDITPHIKFNTMVEEVKPISMETDEGGAVRWEVISRGTHGGHSTQTFDSVFICSGHYSEPHLPSIPGIEHFKGKVMHSHSYRYPEPFAHQSVVVLGAGPSGLDISLELAQVEAQVILSHNKASLPFSLPLEIQQAPSVVKVLDDGSVLFQDGSVAHAQFLLLCTGYSYHFPFLCLAELGLEVQHHLVAPLYKYLMLPTFPSLFFIGVCKSICPFLHFYYQIQFALAVLDGNVQLPSRELMEEDIEREKQRKTKMGIHVKHFLKMASGQWDYYASLAKAAGLPPPNPVIKSLYEEHMEEEVNYSGQEAQNADDPALPGARLVAQNQPQNFQEPGTQDQDLPIMHWEDLSLRIAELEKQEEERKKKAESMVLTDQESVTGPWPHVNYQSLNRKQWEDPGDLGGHRFPCMTSRAAGAWSLSQETLGMRRGAPWTGCQSIAGFNTPKNLQLCFINDSESDQEGDEGASFQEKPQESQSQRRHSAGLKEEVRAALSELRDKLWAEQRQQQQLSHKDVSFRRRKLSRSDLQTCSVLQLNALRRSLHEDIQDLSSELVKHLVVRDNLRTKQDAMLLDTLDFV
ncbi:flavin-containing monooxygenase FMO GS-OX-like 4 [Clarias magur]|uniref:Flavin-containing monooxygenase n=1 Tax=Clarias magur TaxID=1594786 RepID=A0A8J4XFH3_CLAMG|nr:flavin-containing monooxygenase FMO GS-OX-like 4 [Clarias magur]